MKFLLIGLTLIFTIAKILGFINWSWWLVFMPTVIDAILLLLVFIIAVVAEAKKDD